MRIAAPMTFGARLAAHQITKEDLAWFFNVPVELLSDVAPVPTTPAEAQDKVQIGPLDV